MTTPDLTMANNQSVMCPVVLTDNAGNSVAGAELDAGSATVSVSNEAVITASISSDQTQLTIVAQGGPASTGNTVTVNGTIGGVAVPNPGVIQVDIVVAVTNITIVPGTPVTD